MAAPRVTDRRNPYRRPSFVIAIASWALAAASMVFGQTLWGSLFPYLSSNDLWGFLPLFGMYAFFLLGLVSFLFWIRGAGRSSGARPSRLRRAALFSWAAAAVGFIFSSTVSPYLSNGTFRDFLPMLLTGVLFVAGAILYTVSAGQRPATVAKPQA